MKDNLVFMFYPVLCWPLEKPFVVTPTWHKKHQKKKNNQKQKQYSNNKPEHYLKPISFGKNIFSDTFHYNPILTDFSKGKDGMDIRIFIDFISSHS